MKKEKEFEIILKDGELKYQPYGSSEFISAKKLVLKAPCVRQERVADKLSQVIMRAFKSLMSIAKDDGKQEKKKDMSATDILVMLKMSDVDFSEIKDLVKDLLFDGSCLIDGTLPMRQDHYEKIDNLDKVNEIIGEYLANFPLPSLFSQKK